MEKASRGDGVGGPYTDRFSNVYCLIISLYVILSAGRSPKSNFHRVENEVKVQGVAAAGYGLKSRWLLNRCYICRGKPPKFPAISLRRVRSSVFARIVPASGSLPHKNFDYKNRSAIFSLRMTYKGVA